MKTCASCEAEKPLSEFYDQPRTSTGKGSYCKVCHKVRARAWNVANRGAVRASRARVRAHARRVVLS